MDLTSMSPRLLERLKTIRGGYVNIHISIYIHLSIILYLVFLWLIFEFKKIVMASHLTP